MTNGLQEECQQKELIGATLLDSAKITLSSSCQLRGNDSKFKSNLLIFRIFSLIAGFGSGLDPISIKNQVIHQCVASCITYHFHSGLAEWALEIRKLGRTILHNVQNITMLCCPLIHVRDILFDRGTLYGGWT